MDAERPDRVVDLFARANELVPAERGAFLARECGDDTALLREVQSLLDHTVEEPPSRLLGWKPDVSPPAFADLQPGDVVRNFRIERSLGEGGMGIVYLAEQTAPVNRSVALKVIRPGMDTKHLLARFEAERQVLALMNHPSIAKVFDAGATENGRPYFVMEYVDGTRITDYCDTHRLSIDKRLRLFIKVCQAIHHAHSQGVIHRDIKPSNVLIAEVDGTPLPKIIDFGISKALGRELIPATMSAEHGLLLGTPEYMSPEQASSGPRKPPDERTDVYSLGALLYTLLTGQAPLEFGPREQQTVETVRSIILGTDPARPSTCVRSLGEQARDVASKRQVEDRHLLDLLRSDLDWIVMRALEKDRARRYASALELADDIQRYLDHQPVVARPPSVAYRTRKYLRRHRTQFVGAAAILVALVGGIVLARMLPPKGSRTHAVADVTTNSLEASRHYVEGRNFVVKGDMPAARRSFEAAIAADSTFAMAWIELTTEVMAYYGGMAQSDQEAAARIALRYSEKASPRERRYIVARAKAFAGDKEGAIADLTELCRDFPHEKRYYIDLADLASEPRVSIAYLDKAIAIDSADPLIYSDLAYRYSIVGDNEKALWAINQHLHLVPNNAYGYDTRGDIHGVVGQVQEAADSYRRAVQIDSAFSYSWIKLGLCRLVVGDEAGARECWEHVCRLPVPDMQAWARYLIALIPHYRGHARESCSLLEDAVEADRQVGYNRMFLVPKYNFIAYYYLLIGEKEKSDAAFEVVLAQDPSTVGDDWGIASYVAYCSEIDVDRAERALTILLGRKHTSQVEVDAIAKAWVEMARGRYAEAVNTIETVDTSVPLSRPFQTNYTKGVAYLRVGRWRESIEMLEYCRDMFNMNKVALQWAVRVHYFLGQAYEGRDRRVEAIEEYQKFIDIWHDADPEYQSDVNDARQRLNQLRLEG